MSTEYLWAVIIAIILVIVAYVYLTYRRPIIVGFFNTGCGACKAMKPEWDKFKSSTSCSIREYNEDPANIEYRRNFNVVSVPSIWKITHDNRRYEFGKTRQRTAEELHKFVEESSTTSIGEQ
jgi:thiol-disulfide isomerase/thioredoxin